MSDLIVPPPTEIYISRATAEEIEAERKRKFQEYRRSREAWARRQVLDQIFNEEQHELLTAIRELEERRNYLEKLLEFLRGEHDCYGGY